MKKILAIFLSIIIMFVFSSCGSSGNKKTTSSSSKSTSKSSSNYSTTSKTQYENPLSVLKISGISVTHNSSYTVCTGSIKNTGKKTYRFVEVKGSFKTSSGTVVDTDWTYAVGSEGLAPGESSKFRLSVTKDLSIRNCSVIIQDYS